MHPAQESRRYIVMLSLIGWALSQNDPCIYDDISIADECN